MNEKVLIISITDQDSDPRIIRQNEFLKDSYDIYCCGIKNTFIPKEKFIRVNSINNTPVSKIITGTLKISGLYDYAERYALSTKLRIDHSGKLPEFDLVIANDFDTLALAFRIFKTKKVLADFHEYAPSEFEDKLYWKYVHKKFVIHQCRKYFPGLSAVTTVCKSIADKYETEFGKRPVVITNASGYQNLNPGPVKDRIRIIHHGAAISSRRIELMIETAMLLDERFTLDLMLVPNEMNYYMKLKDMIAGNNRIKIIEPVSYKDIIPFCNSYDIGMFILPPANFNYESALPNKFFEFVQSRLAIVTGPSKEMSDYIDKFDLGIHSKTFDPADTAREINELSDEQIMNFKNNSHKYSKELSAEKNKIILNDLVKNILSD